MITLSSVYFTHDLLNLSYYFAHYFLNMCFKDKTNSLFFYSPLFSIHELMVICTFVLLAC